MSVQSIRIDDSVKNETVRIANLLGLSFNAVVEISLRQFNRNKGFSEPLRLEEEPVKSYLEMTPEETEAAMQQAIREKSAEDPDLFVTQFDEDGNLCRKYPDGRVEYVLA